QPVRRTLSRSARWRWSVQREGGHMPRRWSRAAFPLAAIGLRALVVASCSPAPATPTKSGPAPGAGPAAAAGATAASGTAPQPQVQQLPPIRVAYVAPVASMMPLWLAKESGAFERAGVPVEVKLIQSNAAVAALIAGEVDLLQLSAPPVVTAGVQDADLVFIAGALNNMIHSAHVQAQLSSAEALKGMLWGSDRPGTPNDFDGRRHRQAGPEGLRPADHQHRDVRPAPGRAAVRPARRHGAGAAAQLRRRGRGLSDARRHLR